MSGPTHGASPPLHTPLWSLCRAAVVMLVAMAACGDGFRLYSGYYNSLFRPVVEQSFKAKVETLGAVLKRHVQQLRSTENKQVDLVFLVDSSASVGGHYFREEIKFVRKLLADFTVDVNTTRVAVITFSSRGKVVRQVDHLSLPSHHNHKCSLMVEEMPRIRYVGGGTYTLGAILEAKAVLRTSRDSSMKAIFLITDGFSNGGDPRPEAERLKQQGVKIFTFGIRNGNVRELWEMASEPRGETCYVLESFEEFEALARRALHSDIHSGTYVPQSSKKCSSLCSDEGYCCHANATCTCGTHTGTYECLCKPGYYGNGLGKEGCRACPPGTYKNHTGSGDVSICTPCPDKNQETARGATLVHECTCKRGFRNFNSTECTVFRCSELRKPANGYFVNNQCDNVFNAACGLRCQPGYELRGSGLRICQEDGSWSGQDTLCVLKTCPALPSPKNGHMVCTTDDFRYPTVCRFTCQAGYQLLGSRKRSCLAIAFWTGITARCREITCPPLPEIRDGVIQPVLCTDEEVPFGTTCQLSCVRGYKLRGPPAKQCTPDGTWSAISREPNQCVDETAPYLHCPENIEVPSDPENDTTEVTWKVPVAVDNSGFIPVLTSDPAVVPPVHLPIGVTVVTYRAEDLSKNVAKCKFYVMVVDETPPRIDKCFSPPPVVSTGPFGNVTWEEPIFTDNSGVAVEVVASHSPGELFPQGHTTVTYTAFDNNGNNSTCTIDVQVSPHPCQIPDPPVNGERMCRESEEGVHCTLSCLPGYAFVVPPPSEYFCAYDNVWKPADQMPFPDCAAQQVSNEVLQPASITLTGDLSCTDHKLLNRVEQNIQAKVTDKLNSLCDNDVVCELDEIHTTCDDHVDFNKISAVANRRRKRAAARRRNRASIKFDFTLEGTVNSTGHPQEAADKQVQLTKAMRRMLKELQAQAKAGQFDLYLSGRWLKFSDMDFDARRQRNACPEGAILRNNTCVKCPVGMFYNVVFGDCRSCPKGTYQPTEGRLTCLVCPEKTSTSSEHARSELDCRAQCLPGSFSPTGLERCETCLEGFYQPKYAQTKCLPCPDGSTSLRRGARLKEHCKERCPAGHVSRTGLSPCYPCPFGTYQPEEGQNVCIVCPNLVDTEQRAATSITQCVGLLDLQNDDTGTFQAQEQDQQLVDASVCFSNPCDNGGTCIPKDGLLYECKCPKGFEGVFCSTEVNQCDAKPCLNGGSCNPLPDSYICDCPSGFEGQKCQVNINDCDPSPCQNGGTCVDGANNFTCNCPNGFTGVTCEDDVNDCEDDPCRNGGTCEDDVSGFRCACPVGFSGLTCEVETDMCLSSPCQNGGLCVDEPGSFRCECTDGYTGKLCEKDVDECASNPCQHEGTCKDQVSGYICYCTDGYSGTNCHMDMNAQYQLDFPAPSTMDYAVLTIDQPLTALTVSFWMISNDVDNYGTAFSYALPNADNTLTLTDYNGFAFYVNQESVITDVLTNDGFWHHVVITWSTFRGNWKIYVDGLLNDSGFDLSTAKPVPGQGQLVIGQEQDSMGGGFSANEAFVGTITRFNVWDEELSLATIERMRVSCEKFHGTVIAWPDVQSSLRGSLSAQPNSFCQECPQPDDIEFGKASYESLTPGSEITFSCLRGFSVAGPASTVCLITGKYELPAPRCQRVDCGNPGSIDNGFFNGWAFSFDNRVRFTCQKGFKLKGSDTLYCNEFGVWEGEKPDCLEITCPLPPLSTNTILSTIQDSAFKPGDSAVFHCSPGHKLLTAHDSVLCQSDGTWDRSVPTCDPQTCSSPPFILEASPDSSKDEYNVGETVRYECSFGYMFNTKAANPTGALSCLPSGQWEPNEPECVLVQCQEPPIIAHASIDGVERGFLAQVIYECFPGYMIEGFEAIECIESGEWDPEPPQCIAVDCGEPLLVEHGEVLGTDFSFNSVVTYSCSRGYTLLGPAKRRCDEEAVWEGEEPVCQAVDCGPLADPANGVVLALVTSFGEEAVYECDEGYVLEGDNRRTCNEEGVWTLAEPSCRAVECGPVYDIDHGSFQAPPLFTFGARVLYSCQQGYRLVGSNEMTCGSDGYWSNEEPFCLAVECPQPAQPEHGTAVALGLIYTSKVEYTCDPNYRLEGEAIRTCEADGAWGGEEPVCVAMTCPTPADLENGALEYKDLTISSIVRYSCNVGYRLEGVEVRRCQPDLSLSDRAPVCIAVTCPAPPLPQYGSITLSRDPLLVGSRVTYTCDVGYYIVAGVATRTCSVEGTLSGQAPVCRPVECVKPGRIISNGRMIGSSYTFNSTINYVCDEGYRMEGEAQRVCLASSEWSAPIPVCIVVECPRLSVVNGFASTFSREFGTVVTFSCRARHRLEGSTERTCMANGAWSGEDTVCVKITCPPPLTLENGQSRLADEVTLEYSCNEGFRMEGANSSSCGEDGLWSPGAPMCILVTCSDISAVRLDHGMVVLSENFGNYMSLVQYVCDNGYTLVGVSQRACTSTGQWEAEAPTCQIVTCPQPEPVLNGKIVGDVYTYGAEITYVCTEGYQLIGDASRRCQAQGFWDGSSPQCGMISCPDISSTELVNGIVLMTGNQFGSSIQYSCNPGYTLVGTSQRQCVGRGEWEGVAPTCQINSCRSPPEIFNGVVIGNDFSFGAEVTYECVQGSKLVGNARRRCQADGLWDGEAPHCELIICPPIHTTLANGVINIVSGFFGGTVEYMCNPGFTLQGDATRSCNASGAWSGEEPVCVALECAAPPPVENGTIIGDNFGIARSVMYRCDEGFALVGATTLICLPNLQWSFSAPLCERVSCPPIPPLQFATAIDDGHRYGDTVQFLCHAGYEMMGVDSVRCQANGAWDAKLPECLPVSCGLPPLIDNATPLIEDGMLFPANITYVCNTGYTARGSGFSTCQADGWWSAASFWCDLVVCPRISPDELDHGSVQVTSFSYGQTAGFACNEGYSMVGSSSAECLAEGFWSAQVPYCEIITCPEPDAILYGGVTVEAYTYNGTALYGCDHGYRLRGEAVARCTETGAWSAEARECVMVTCAPPPLVIPNGRLKGIQLTFNYQEHAEYECDVGFELVGSARITCMADGLFDPSPPSCAKIQCPSPGTPPHGSVTVQNDELIYSCLAGYELVGLQRRPCLSSGQWEGVEPVCIPVLCAPPPPVLNGHFQGLQFQFGSTVSYYCDTGYLLRGNRNRTCLAERVWSGEEPVCRRVTCGEPRPVEFAFVIGDGYAYNDTVAYECEQGFELIGHTHRTCLDTGEWSGKSPYCDEILCDDPPQIDHASHDGSYGLGVWGFGSLVMYMCDAGYVMMGASSVLCQEDGTWSRPLPTCPPVTCPALTLREHSRVTGDNFTFGAVVRFTCDGGYRMVGEESLQCTESGRWSGEVPDCHLIKCEIPPIENGGGLLKGSTDSSFVSSLLPGQTADFRCYPGYRVGGTFSTTCLEDGTLTNTPPQCYPVTCGQPPVITHGSVDPRADTYLAGDSVSFSCDLGYELEGAASLVCDDMGSWVGTVPKCVDVICDAPPSVPHATVVGADEGRAKTTLAGGWILYRCEDGFALDHNHSGRLSCLRGGVWSDKVPHCVHIDCGPPPVPFYASVTTQGTSAGSLATVLCNHGYLLANREQRLELVCDVSGSWLGTDEANCVPVDCRQPPSIVNMMPFDGINTTFGSRSAYRCLPGYVLTGEAEIECTDNGTWDSNGLDPPTCLPVDCQQPPPIPNMAPFNSISTTFGHRAAYSCLPGYRLMGQAEIECTHSGTWDHNGLDPVTCAPVDCGPPQTDMRVAEGSSFTFGSTVALTCAEGSRAVGFTSITCTEQGQWSPFPGTCEKILCPVLIPPADGYFTGSARTVGDSVEIQCYDGFARVGDPVVTCLPTGSWSSDVPICEVVRDSNTMCEDTIHVQNMVVPPDGYFPGDSVVLSCRAGYRPEGDLTSLCEEDLTWATPLGSCVRVSCGQPRVSNPLQVKVFARSTLYGDTAMYMCRPGLTPVHNPPTLTCTASGDWDSEAECLARCKRPCRNGGRCVALNKCKCRSGFTGLQCEIPICILPCLNGGVCQGPYVCSCPSGYYGSRCHKAICDRPCQNGGRCLHPNRCQCYNGFKPPFCEKSYFGVIEPK